MAQEAENVSYFHLSGAMLEIGSIITPGNWGRVLRHYGWRHQESLKEMALEYARQVRFSHRPSRLDCAFVFLTAPEARDFRARVSPFNSHVLYRVTLIDPGARSHITDTRLSSPQGSLHYDWPDAYWRDFDPATVAIPGAQLALKKVRDAYPAGVQP
jgi:hypothetical protein